MTTKNNKETNNTFDLESALNDLQYPEMFKAGLKAYILKNKKTVKSDKDLNKIVKEFSEVKL